MSAATDCPDCGFTLNLTAHGPAECLLCGYVDGEVLVAAKVVDRPRSRRIRTTRRRPPMPWRFPRPIDRR